MSTRFGTCKDCLYSVGLEFADAEMYECHFAPPSSLDMGAPQFPILDGDSWCGQWQHKNQCQDNAKA